MLDWASLHCPSGLCDFDPCVILIGVCFFLSSGTNASSSEASCISEEIRENLEFIIEEYRSDIVKKYAAYVKCIRLTIEKKVSVDELRSYLLTLEALKSSSVQCKLFAGAKQELEKASTIHRIFDIVTLNFASFLDFGVYQCIADHYGIKGEELNYSEHLKEYVKKHKISELAMLQIPKFCPSTDDTKTISIKIDIEEICESTRITNLKKVIAKVLKVMPYTIRLQSIKEGCVTVTFCIPTPVADIIFTRGKTFTPLEEEELCSLSVLWLECNGCKFYFKESPPAAEAPTGSSSGKEST